jgi:hypothetical protein
LTNLIKHLYFYSKNNSTLRRKNMESPFNQPVQVAIGVRYEPQHRVADHAGMIIDKILHSPNSPFDPNFFPLTTAELNGRTLHNDETKDFFTVSHTDLILMVNSLTNFGTVDKLAEAFYTFGFENLLSVARIENIVRYGCLCGYLTSIHDLKKQMTSLFLSEFGQISDFAIRFAKRLPVEEAYLKKGVSDFHRMIFIVNQALDGKINISVDFQRVFDPPLQSSAFDKYPIPKFVSDAQHHINKHGLPYFADLLKDKAA